MPLWGIIVVVAVDGEETTGNLTILPVYNSDIQRQAALRMAEKQRAFEQGRNTTSSCPENGITYRKQMLQGMGATYLLMMQSYLYARRQNQAYCTTPWEILGHAPAGVRSQDDKITFAHDMFQFLGGYRFGPLASEVTTPIDSQVAVKFMWRTLSESELDEIRTFYFIETKPPLDHFRSAGGNPTVAWHLRRGDAEEHDKSPRWQHHAGRYVPNDQIIASLTWIRRVLPRLRHMHFYSEGELADFHSINEACEEQSITCEWHLSEDLKSTFHHLVMADVLIYNGKSAFGHVAHLLNRGSHHRKLDKHQQIQMMDDYSLHEEL